MFHFRVRDGTGWGHRAMTTRLRFAVLLLPHLSYPVRRGLSARRVPRGLSLDCIRDLTTKFAGCAFANSRASTASKLTYAGEFLVLGLKGDFFAIFKENDQSARASIESGHTGL